jgi:hypothetical protein
MHRLRAFAGAAAIAGLAAVAAAQPSAAEPPWQAFLAAGNTNRRTAEAALADIAARWRDQYAALVVDVARFFPASRGPAPADESLPLDMDDASDQGSATGTSSSGWW